MTGFVPFLPPEQQKQAAQSAQRGVQTLRRELTGGGPAADPTAGQGPVPEPPNKGETVVQDAASEVHRRAALRRGRASTVLTGGTGAFGPAPTARAVLLGR